MVRYISSCIKVPFSGVGCKDVRLCDVNALASICASCIEVPSAVPGARNTFFVMRDHQGAFSSVGCTDTCAMWYVSSRIKVP